MTSLNRMKKLLAWLLAVSACISMAACPVAAAETTPAEPSGIATLAAGGAAVDETTQWRYLDNNTDPAGDSAAEGYDRLSWTKAGYDDSSWKTAAGTFGAKNGGIANLGAGYTDVDFTPSVLLSQYINGASGDDIPAFFFRTTFQVENASAVTKLLGELYYDDAAIVYINGVKVAAFDEPNGGYASNLSYGGSNAGAPKLGEISVSDTSVLVNGDNILAVELHQGRSSSSDIYLAVKKLSLSAEPVSDELEVDSLTVNIGETEDCLGITWYDTDPEAAVLHWNGTDYTAAVKQASKTGYYVNHVDLSGLKPSTQYTYTITAGGKTSKEYSYKTPAFGGESFTFAAVGDPQLYANNLSANVEGWTKTVNEVLSDGTDYSFLFSLGDQINEYYAQDGSNLSKVESEYSGFFNNENLQSIALATLVGNHDNGNNSTLYTEHFQMPGVTSYGQNREGDGDYSFTYGGVQFMVLNTSNLSIADHKAFLEDTLKKNPNANWNVVCFHKSMYSVASHVTEGDIVQLRTGLSPIFKQLGIDVVLQGHDHVYARSYIMGGEDGMTADVQKNEDGTALTDIYQPDGVQYVTLNSGSGSKFYKITNEAFTYTAVQNQEKVPNYSKVSVTPDTFTVTTYRTSDQSVVDTFTLHKNAESKELNVEDLVVNIGAKEDTVTVSWYDQNDTEETLTFDGKEYKATSTAVDKKGYYVHRAEVTGLKEKTDYTYTIACGDKTSKEYSYHTGSFGDSFTFAAVGDPQLYAKSLDSNIEGWTKTVNEVLSDGTDYSFLYSMGDQINEYYAQDGSNVDKVESEYTGFFTPEGLSSMALATAVGNHDNGNNSKLYTDHFSLPNTTDYGAVGTGDGDYYFNYGGVLFMTLNTSNLSIAEHKAFLEDTLKKNPNANWNVVSFHKSIYSVASHVTEDDIVQLRTGLSPIFKQLGIDVVLQGHDHVYARSYIMGGEDGMTADVQKNEDGTALTDIYQPDGVQYVTLNSGSGSKFYKITNEAFTYTAVQNQEKVPNYSKVSVTPDTFTVTTYRTSDQSVVDTFTLHKNAKDPEQPEQPEKPEKQPCDGGANCPTKGFTDVDQTRYYHEAVDQLYQDGIMKGMSDTVYGVDQPMTRGMVVTVLYRMAGSPDVTGTSTFTDLRKGAYYEKAVIWAAENDIAQGYNKATFAPDQTVSRQQMAAFLYRYAKLKGMDVSGQSDLSGFKDNGSVGQYAKTAMAWAVNAGIIQGTATDTLAPTDALLRQQCAVMLYRLENIK